MNLVKTLTHTAVVAALCSPLAAMATTIVPAAINDHVQLGTAYNELSNNFLNYQPVQGQVVVSDASSTSIIFDQNLSLSQVSSVINGNGTIDANFPVIDVNAHADVALSSASDNFSSTWVFSQVVNGPNKSLAAFPGDSSLRLSAEGTLVEAQNGSGTLTERLDRSGTHYVTQINYGASLFVVMKAEYLNAADRTAIEAGLDVSLGANTVTADLNGQFLDDRLRQQVRITVRAHQFGGNPLLLSQAIPENVAQCSLTNFEPCRALFVNAINYARGSFVDQLVNTNGSVNNLDQLNVINYAAAPFTQNRHGDLAPPIGGYRVEGNDTSGLEQEYEQQLEVYKRTTSLLGDLQGGQTTIQREAIRAIGEAALANAGTVQDIVNFCRENPFNNDCVTYVNNNCPVVDGEYSCLHQYSEAVLDVPQSVLEQTLAQHNRVVKNSSYQKMGFDMLSARYAGGFSGGNTTINQSTGEIHHQFADEAFFVEDFSYSYVYGPQFVDFGRTTRSFVIKADKRMEVRMGNRSNHPGVYGSVKIYANDEWRTVSSTETGNHFFDRDFERNHTSVDGSFYYLVEFEDMIHPYVSMWSTANDTKFTIYTSDIKSMPNGDGLTRDNIPFYFNDKNITVSKDVNGNDIGWCVKDNGGLQRGNTKDCNDYGRRYTWDEAVRACEAYNDVHDANGSSGLVWRLPSKKDYDDLVTTIGQTNIAGVSGAGREGRYLKSWHFTEYTGFNDMIGTNTLGFNIEPTGYLNYPHNFGSDIPTNRNRHARSWASTESGGSAYAFSVRHNHNHVSMPLRDKRDLLTVRCIGSYTK